MTATVPLQVLALCFGWLCFSNCAEAAAAYRITDLGANVRGVQLNNLGQVVGTWGGTAFLYSGGVMTDLGTLGGSRSEATGINDSGQITGSASTANDAAFHAFLYGNGVMTDIGTLGGSHAYASAINAKGQVAGSSFFGGGGFALHAFIYSGGVMADLGTLGGISSSAMAINRFGLVAGTANPEGNTEQHAFLGTLGGLNDISGTLGGTYSVGTDVNDAGQVAGYFFPMGGGNLRAFIYNDIAIDLGSLGGGTSAAFALNGAGDVVGESTLAGNEIYHAFLYRNGSMLDLNTMLDAASQADWTLQQGMDINDQGQIVVLGSKDGMVHTLLLTPVPELSTSMLLVLGLSGIAMATARRNKVVLGRKTQA